MKKEIFKVDEGSMGIRNVAVELPPNSNKHKTTNTAKTIEKIVTGSVTQEKKTLGRKIKETLFGEDINSVSSYIIHDVIVPAAKNTISEMVSGGIEMLLYGETRGTRTMRDRGKSYVSYNRMKEPERQRPMSNVNKARHNFDDIKLESRIDAEEVLSNLVDLIEDYGSASVADLYALVGLDSAFTDNKYGWFNLNTATVSRVRNGYLLDLPKPILID